MTTLKDAYAMGYDLILDLHRATRIPEAWTRWPATSTYQHLDALPVSITKQGETWVVALDFDSAGDGSWSNFTNTIKTTAMAKLAAEKSLRKFALDHDLNYTGVWRAKSRSELVTERLIHLVGAEPTVIQKPTWIVCKGRILRIEEDE